jgi:ABC-type multidrug transport system ATPase subunit
MKQKLLAALALAAEAPVLVCDEPTANLDGEARAEFMRQLDARPKGGVVILCSHRIEEVRVLVDRVVELSEGRVFKDAPVEEMLPSLAERARGAAGERSRSEPRGQGPREDAPLEEMLPSLAERARGAAGERSRSEPRGQGPHDLERARGAAGERSRSEPRGQGPHDLERARGAAGERSRSEPRGQGPHDLKVVS